VDIQGTMEFILEQQAAIDAKLDKLAENAGRHEKEIAAINTILRRAIRLGVEEQRRERVRRQELEARFEEKVTQLAAVQLLAEEQTAELRRLFENWLRRSGGNGQQPS
jgi:predicted metal-dependent hydrolase